MKKFGQPRHVPLTLPILLLAGASGPGGDVGDIDVVDGDRDVLALGPLLHPGVEPLVELRDEVVPGQDLELFVSLRDARFLAAAGGGSGRSARDRGSAGGHRRRARYETSTRETLIEKRHAHPLLADTAACRRIHPAGTFWEAETYPSWDSASRAASCSAACFVPPCPVPSGSAPA